jgi:hypothetical protein
VIIPFVVARAASTLDDEFDMERLLAFTVFKAASTLELEFDNAEVPPPLPPPIVALTAFIAASMLDEEFERLSEVV